MNTFQASSPLMFPRSSQTPFNYTSGNDFLYANNPPMNIPSSTSSSRVAEIEAKMALHEMEYTKENSLLQERIKQFLLSETELKRELSHKTNELTSLKQQLQTLYDQTELSNSKAFDYEQQLTSMKSKYKSLEHEIQSLYTQLTSLNNLNKQYQSQISEYAYVNEKLEQDMATMNTLIEKYSSDISELQSKLTLSNKENANIETMLTQIESENKKLNEMNGVLQSENSKLKTEISVHKERYTEIEKRNNELENEIKKYQNESISNNQNITRLQIELETQGDKYQQLLNEKTKLDKMKTNNEKNEFNFNSEIIKLKNELSTIISITNDNLNSLTHWIENYLPTLYSPNVQLPEINFNTNLTNEDSSIIINNFDILKKTLIQAKHKIDNELSSKLTEIKNMKTALTQGQDELYKAHKFIEDIHTLMYNEIEIGKYFNMKTKFTVDKDYQQEIEDLLRKVFSILKMHKRSQDEEYVCKLIQDNTLLSGQVKEIKLKLEEVMKDNCSLDKRNKYLQNEIELKKAQIKSQEEILKRRSALEEDNKKLLRDNLTLINKVKGLKSQLQQQLQMQDN